MGVGGVSSKKCEREYKKTVARDLSRLLKQNQCSHDKTASRKQNMPPGRKLYVRDMEQRLSSSFSSASTPHFLTKLCRNHPGPFLHLSFFSAQKKPLSPARCTSN